MNVPEPSKPDGAVIDPSDIELSATQPIDITELVRSLTAQD
ncbi:hypothetical protein BH09ACT7_BH09ACT7_04650 [soil metagenome]